jgi:hypothetical protein
VTLVFRRSHTLISTMKQVHNGLCSVYVFAPGEHCTTGNLGSGCLLLFCLTPNAAVPLPIRACGDFPPRRGGGRTGGVCVGQRLALCDLNNTWVGHYGGHDHGWLVVTCWIPRYRMCRCIKGIRSPKGILFSGQS